MFKRYWIMWPQSCHLYSSLWINNKTMNYPSYPGLEFRLFVYRKPTFNRWYLGVEAIEKGFFGSSSTTIAKFTTYYYVRFSTVTNIAIFLSNLSNYWFPNYIYLYTWFTQQVILAQHIAAPLRSLILYFSSLSIILTSSHPLSLYMVSYTVP